MNNSVRAWVEKTVIPTYNVGEPEKNPIFLEKRVYQGSSGVVYPHPVTEKIFDEKIDKEYEAVFIENEFIKIMILPELGGRVQRAYDKIRKRDFVYYNQVIKPALVGLTGPWISGGIEFNWPQHHRPSTFEPIDFIIENNKDGSKTVWVNEVEKMFRTKGMAGFTLYPGKAYLEVKVKLYNKSSFPQSFLWWANPAVKVNEYYQSVFPPDVHAVFDHGKRDVSDFPIATGMYYKVNYAPGTDISMYKNIPVPTSYMAIRSKYNFIGCYEHDTEAGMLHVANHHVSTGKKQWTWGNGDFGKAWDRNLTDEDGPYIELMCGVFTDNQPDFSWLQPNEEKSFEQYFMPYTSIGIIKNASKDAAINVDLTNNELSIKVYATGVFSDAKVHIYRNEKLIYKIQCQLSPFESYEQVVKLDNTCLFEELEIQVKDGKGMLLVSYKPENKINREIPEPAKAIRRPEEIESIELLYLSGLHLEQYRHATFLPKLYYDEAIKRDPDDIRSNNAIGLIHLRNGQFENALPYFYKALNRLTERNPNPIEGTVLYNLGLCLKHLGKIDEAYSMLYKATWNDECQHNAFFELARIASIKHDYNDALYLIDKALIKNTQSHNARHLKVVLLRKMGNLLSSHDFINESLKIDRFNYGCLFEQYLMSIDESGNSDSKKLLINFRSLIRNCFNNYLEYALDYLHAGFYGEAISLLTLYEESNPESNPLLYYYLGWFYYLTGHLQQAKIFVLRAAKISASYCFPSKIEDKMVLEWSINFVQNDAKSHYYLGNYWYSKRQYKEAITHWEISMKLDPFFPTVSRNLSLAYYNNLKNTSASLLLLERAFFLDTSDARVLMELDQLYKLQNYSPSMRLSLLEEYLPLVNWRDDLYLERVTIYNQLENCEKAKKLLSDRLFHPWEGGEGRVVYQYLNCHVQLAIKAITEGRNEDAIRLLDQARLYPENLGEGKLYGAQENDIDYLQGCAYAAMNLAKEATEKFIAATQGTIEPAQAIFYNDPQPDKILYQGLAWLKLGDERKAIEIFTKLIDFGEKHLNDKIEIDYFAVSLPDLLVFNQNLDIKNNVFCQYIIGLGMLGLGKYNHARKKFESVIESNVNHQGALLHLNMIDFLKNK